MDKAPFIGWSSSIGEAYLVATGFAAERLHAPFWTESDGRRVDAEEIRKAAERAAALTGQLLAFGRPQLAPQQVTDLTGALPEEATVAPGPVEIPKPRKYSAKIRSDPSIATVSVTRRVHATTSSDHLKVRDWPFFVTVSGFASAPVMP